MPSYPHNPQIILASGSSTKQSLLRKAGYTFQICPSHVNESRIKDIHAHTNVSTTALLLAIAKAGEISALYPSDYVIGCDQMIECEKRQLNKPQKIEDVYETLRFLNGKQQILITAAVVMKANKIIWFQVDENKLTLKKMTTEEINAYLKEEGENVIGCLGGIKIEDHIDLFDRVEGNIASIQGLPIEDLSIFLKKEGF